MDDPDWHWGVCNRGPEKLLIWLEPWAEEFEVPVGSSLTLKVINERRDEHSVEVDQDDDHIVVWANGGDKALISIDGVIQDSWSATNAFPELPTGMSAKSFLTIVFENAPEARLGGRVADIPEPISLLGRIARRLRTWR